MRHVISALVMNEPGVLASVAGLFSARGFNIDSLVVGRTTSQFRVNGAPVAIKTVLSECPLPAEQPVKRAGA